MCSQTSFMLFSGGHMMIMLVSITKSCMHHSTHDILHATRQTEQYNGQTRSLYYRPYRQLDEWCEYYFLHNTAYGIYKQWKRPQENVRSNDYIFTGYNQRDAAFLNLFSSQDALHVSGGSSAHHQEHKNCTYSVRYFVRPMLLPAAIVEEMELHGVLEFHLFHDSSK